MSISTHDQAGMIGWERLSLWQTLPIRVRGSTDRRGAEGVSHHRFRPSFRKMLPIIRTISLRGLGASGRPIDLPFLPLFAFPVTASVEGIAWSVGASAKPQDCAIRNVELIPMSSM